MAETANVTVPVSDKPPTTSWAVGRTSIQHYDSRGNVAWALHLEIVEWYASGVRSRDIDLVGVIEAKPLIVQLNTLNLSGANPSFEKKIMQWLVTNGYYPASTYAGSPEV